MSVDWNLCLRIDDVMTDKRVSKGNEKSDLAIVVINSHMCGFNSKFVHSHRALEKKIIDTFDLKPESQQTNCIMHLQDTPVLEGWWTIY